MYRLKISRYHLNNSHLRLSFLDCKQINIYVISDARWPEEDSKTTLIIIIVIIVITMAVILVISSVVCYRRGKRQNAAPPKQQQTPEGMELDRSHVAPPAYINNDPSGSYEEINADELTERVYETPQAVYNNTCERHYDTLYDGDDNVYRRCHCSQCSLT